MKKPLSTERYVVTDESASHYGVAAVSSLVPLAAGDTLGILLGNRRLFLTVESVRPKEGQERFPTLELVGPRSANHVACTGYGEVPVSWTPPLKAPYVPYPRRKPRRPRLA